MAKGLSKSLWYRLSEPLGQGLAKLLVNTPITGNQVSVFIVILTIASFYLITIKSFAYALTGLLILQIVLMLDSTDGYLAKLKGQTSLKGEYLEAIWHECIFPFFYFVLGVSSYKMFGNPVYIIMGGFTTAFILMINLLFHRYNMILRIKGEGGGTRTKIQYLVRWATCPSHTFTYALILLFFNWIHFMVIFYFAFYLLLTLYKLKTFVFPLKI